MAHFVDAEHDPSQAREQVLVQMFAGDLELPGRALPLERTERSGQGPHQPPEVAVPRPIGLIDDEVEHVVRQGERLPLVARNVLDHRLAKCLERRSGDAGDEVGGAALGQRRQRRDPGMVHRPTVAIHPEVVQRQVRHLGNAIFKKSNEHACLMRADEQPALAREAEDDAVGETRGRPRADRAERFDDLAQRPEAIHPLLGVLAGDILIEVGEIRQPGAQTRPPRRPPRPRRGAAPGLESSGGSSSRTHRPG